MYYRKSRFDDTDTTTEIDRSSASASIGVSHFPDGTQEHDGRAKTRTTFLPRDITGTSKNWERMHQIQDGKYGNDVNIHKRHADQERDLAIFMERLKLRQQEKEYAEHVLETIQRYIKDNEDELPYNSETLLLGIITYSVNTHDRMIRNTDEYKRLREVLRVSYRGVKSVREYIRNCM
jgi:hypothetical protein